MTFSINKQENEIVFTDQFIYLSPDADQYLDTFDESKIYIIGGLIDRN